MKTWPSRSEKPIYYLSISLVFTFFCLNAQSTNSSDLSSTRLSADCAESLRIDGFLREDIWQQAVPNGSFDANIGSLRLSLALSIGSLPKSLSVRSRSPLFAPRGDIQGESSQKNYNPCLSIIPAEMCRYTSAK